MNIRIIGAGNIGGNLTRRFQGLGHQRKFWCLFGVYYEKAPGRLKRIVSK